MKIAIAVFLIAFLGFLPSLAVAGSADKRMSFFKPPSQPRFGFIPRAPAAPAPPVAVRPAPPSVSQAPVQRREIIIRREERVVYDYRHQPVFFSDGFVGGPVTAIGFFTSPDRLVEWRGLPYFYRTRSLGFCQEIPVTEERLIEVETAPGFWERRLENVKAKRVVCERR